MHNFDTVLSEIPTLEDCAVLPLAYRGSSEIMVQNDTSAVLITIATGCPALVYSMCGCARVRRGQREGGS